MLRVGLRGVGGRRAGHGEKIYQAAAGEDWDQFVERTVQDACAGLECLAGIPGTVGGTPVQNVGAYGQEVASAIERVRVFDLRQRNLSSLQLRSAGSAIAAAGSIQWIEGGIL